jgi:hypothetical protein
MYRTGFKNLDLFNITIITFHTDILLQIEIRVLIILRIFCQIRLKLLYFSAWYY